MEPVRHVTPEIDILPAFMPLPGYGLLPVNAFLLKSKEPVLIDSGLNMDRDDFMHELESVIDPAEIRWLWLTHPDQDHVGSLQEMLRRSPQMKVITTYAGVGIYTLSAELPLDRIYLLNPGESIDVGDRTLKAAQPPAFDNPSTVGFYDSKSCTFFSSDCFGALLNEPATDAGDISADALHSGQVLWASADAPWLTLADEGKLAARLNTVRDMEPARVLSAHLPPATGMTETLIQALVDTSHGEPFVGPNQAQLQAMLAQMTGGEQPEHA